MPWSVVQTHHNASQRAADELARQGYRVYDPRYAKRIRRSDGRVVVAGVQLFPNYMFVWIADRWRSIASTFGVSKLLMSGENIPAKIDDKFIDMIRGREDKNGLVVIGQSKFNSGDRVQIKSGPLALEKGIFEGKRDGDRASILLSLLGAERRVLIREDDLVGV